jgi:hypothetical protein
MLRIMNFIEAKFIERPHTTDLSAFERQWNKVVITGSGKETWRLTLLY